MARKIATVSDTDTLWVLDDGRHVVIGTDKGFQPTMFASTPEGSRMSGIRGLEEGTETDDASVAAQIENACGPASVKLWDPGSYLGGRAALERRNGKP
jgi:hypothetical protein